MTENGKGLAKVLMEAEVESREYVLEYDAGNGQTFIKYLNRGPLYADIRFLNREGIAFTVSRTVTENFKVTVE